MGKRSSLFRLTFADEKKHFLLIFASVTDKKKIVLYLRPQHEAQRRIHQEIRRKEAGRTLTL